MRFPAGCCQIQPHLSEARTKGFALRVYGTITAQSGCQTAVAAKLSFTREFSAVRQRLRERLYDGADRSTPSPNQIDVCARFRAADRLVPSLWKSGDLALAIDPTTLSDRLSVIVVSVVYRGCAIPVDWVVMSGKWIAPADGLLELLSVAIPTSMRATLMTDRGLRSPKLGKRYASSAGGLTCDSP